MAVTNQSSQPSPSTSPKVDPMPLPSLPTPASRVASVNVPSPSFQNSWEVPKSEATARSCHPSPSRSTRAEANEALR